MACDFGAMNTPAHLLFGAAAFARPEQRHTLGAALIGALLPDLSLYLLVAWHLLVLDTPARIVFDELYFSEAWQRIFAVDNSLLLWGGALTIALWARKPVLVALTGGAVLHVLLDLPLHAGDGRPHFWPVTMWVFDSPFSYWDTAYRARWIGPVELALSALFAVILWRRFASWGTRAVFVVLFGAQAMASNIWRFVF